MNKIVHINKLLLKKFGAPFRSADLPKPIDMLIATILSQNTNDQNSFKAYQNLKSRFPSWEEVNKARRTSIEKQIKIAGLGFQKSTAIKNLLSQLKSTTGKLDLSKITPMNDKESIEYLTDFKGIGVKTASCVLLFSLDKNICPVDTHLHRTLNRIGLVKTKTPDKTFFAINKDFPPKTAHSFHTNLIRLGREICKPKGYTCSICPVEKICEFNEKNFGKAPKTTSKAFMLLDNI